MTTTEEKTTTFNQRDECHYHWTYEVREDGEWRRLHDNVETVGGWKSPDGITESMGEMFARNHAEAMERLSR